MRMVIHIGEPSADGVVNQPIRTSFHWKREEGWIEKEQTDFKVRLAEQGRELWRELFTTVCTEKQLSIWESKIPQYECNCKQFYLDWKASNPPSFPLAFEWKYSLKSAVNTKLGHENLTLAAARKFWESQKTEGS